MNICHGSRNRVCCPSNNKGLFINRRLFWYRVASSVRLVLATLRRVRSTRHGSTSMLILCMVSRSLSLGWSSANNCRCGKWPSVNEVLNKTRWHWRLIWILWLGFHYSFVFRTDSFVLASTWIMLLNSLSHRWFCHHFWTFCQILLSIEYTLRWCDLIATHIVILMNNRTRSRNIHFLRMMRRSRNTCSRASILLIF